MKHPCKLNPVPFVANAARLSLVTGLLSFLVPSLCVAEGFTKAFEVDYLRDVSSRRIQGLAVRSDGRLLAGPSLRDLEATLPADLLWCLAPGQDSQTWLVGTGSEGAVLELSIDAEKGTVQSRELVRLADTHVYALARLSDGSYLAGTSPRGTVSLIRGGKEIASVRLPVDSIFDILPPETKPGREGPILIATGNPGCVYAMDLALFARAGNSTQSVAGEDALRTAGIKLWGEVRDRNLRRLARHVDGRILAGSAPKGNLYAFSPAGDSPVILLENKDAELTDLLPLEDGSVFATFIASSGTTEQRVGRVVRSTVPAPASGAPQALPGPPSPTPVQLQPPAQEQPQNVETPAFAPLEKFSGRGFLVHLPPNGLPDIVSSRSNLAFYRLARHNGTLLIAGGEQGDLLGYDPVKRLALSFPGSASAQLMDIRALGQGRYLLLRNNPAGLALLDFTHQTVRSAETRKLDLGLTTQLGALRFGRLSGIGPSQIQVETRVSLGSDESEGWTPWTRLNPLDPDRVVDVGWASEASLQGRYARLRLKVSGELGADAEIDKARWLHAPLNRRPQLSEFRSLPAGYALIPPAEQAASGVQSLSQLLASSGENSSDKGKDSLRNAQVVPSPGNQVFLWTVSDPDGDVLHATLELRKTEESQWLAVVKDTRDSYAQIDISHLPEGVYHTRLTVSEQAPRPLAARLSSDFETDDLVIDRTPPVLLESSVVRQNGRVVFRARGRDALSLMAGMAVQLNNGARIATENSADQILDSREEWFEVDVHEAAASGATQAELSLYDSLGNRVTTILLLPSTKRASSP